MVERVSAVAKEALVRSIESFVGEAFKDAQGVVWTCDGKGNVTPSDGGEVRKVRDIIRIR